MKQEIKLKGVIECLDDKGCNLYNKLNKRILETKKFMISKYYAGPPDIIYLVREPNKIKSHFGFKSKSQQKYKHPVLNKKFGTFHYVYGMDTSNMSSVINYLDEYIEKQKKFIKKNLKNNTIIDNENPNIYEICNSTIIQGIFCSYDIFMEKDFRIIFRFPGGFENCYYYNSNDEITEDELRTIYLSSVLRAWNYNGENSNISVFFEEIYTDLNFELLVDSINYILIERLEYKYPNLERKIGVLLYWFVKYLMNTRQFSFILTYFSKMSYVDTNLAQFTLKPLYSTNGYAEALQFISTLLCSNTNPLLICSQIEFLTILEKYEHAMKLGKYLTTMNPGFNDAWIKLAELYLKLKQYNKCIKALNNVNYLKVFLKMDNIFYRNPFTVYDENKYINVKEIPLAGNNNTKKIENYIIDVSSIIKYNDLLFCSKYNVDFFYNSTYLTFSENEDLIKDVISKITNSKYYKFNNEQKTIYNILLQIMKEINFTKFLELKNKEFSTLKKHISTEENSNNINSENSKKSLNSNKNANYYNQSTQNNSDSTGCTGNSDGGDISENELLKTLINPFLEEVIDTLIEDIKLFSLGCVQKEKNYLNKNKVKTFNNNNNNFSNNYSTFSFGQLLNKDDLPKCEIKFCIAFGILCERLKYNRIALKYYTKALNYCFSQYVYTRVIKIYLKIKDYKDCISKLNKYLLHYNQKDFSYVCKTPLWIDKIILEVLYEYQASDILLWIKPNSTKEITNFIKHIVNKYKIWTENGHELHLLK